MTGWLFNMEIISKLHHHIRLQKVADQAGLNVLGQRGELLLVLSRLHRQVSVLDPQVLKEIVDLNSEGVFEGSALVEAREEP